MQAITHMWLAARDATYIDVLSGLFLKFLTEHILKVHTCSSPLMPLQASPNKSRERNMVSARCSNTCTSGGYTTTTILVQLPPPPLQLPPPRVEISIGNTSVERNLTLRLRKN